MVADPISGESAETIRDLGFEFTEVEHGVPAVNARRARPGLDLEAGLDLTHATHSRPRSPNL
jgi:hypothetical protein